jgi:DNA-binding response OmpR family regulator
MNQKPFVLVVEDDSRLRKVIAANLEARGYFVFEAETFREAIDRLAIRPQLMILDVHLPDATGWDVADWAQSESVQVPTIIISGYDLDRRKVKRIAPNNVLRKPFDIRQLMGLVDTYLATAH